jgi:hypothetical protein
VNTGTLAEKPRWDYAGVVEDNEFVAREEVRELRELRIYKAATGTFEYEKARSIPAIKGPLSNQSRRKIEAEVFDSHGIQL